MVNSKTPRIYFYDNLKFILITLVVVGHFIQFFLNYDVLKGLFIFIYSFHMPLFIFVTGFFAKKIIDAPNDKRLNKILSYLILYFGYKIILFLVFKYGLNQPSEFYLFSEMETPWYLLACAVWIGIVGLLKNVKPLYLFVFSVIMCLFSGYDNSIGDLFCLSRVIVFFPFFLLGYYATKENMEKLINKLHNKKNMFISGLFVVLCVILCLYFANEIYFLRPLFTGRNPYINIDFPVDILMTGALFRLIWLIFCIFLSIAIMSLIPKREVFFTKFGSRTLQVYVLHYFLAIIIGNSFIGRFLVDVVSAWLPVLLVILAIIVSFILSLKIFEKPFAKILKLDFKKIYK